MTGAAATPRPLVALHGVGKAFDGGLVALDGFDLTVREGEFVSLLGPSGCGKTTVLRLVAGLDQPTSGVVERDGAAGPGGVEGGLSFVFQDATLMPWASVAANVHLPLRIAGVQMAAARPRIDAMLDLVGLAGFAEALPHQLSGGMRMRAAIARALVTRPRLLLMDEPFAALDEITRFRLNDDLIASVAATGCTVIFVTHSIYESAYLSTRIAVMGGRPGRIVAEISIDLPPHVRDESFRRDARFLAAAQASSAALRDAMGGAAREAAA
jgi:NitT/TauT family transport system ATP-binding protein